MLKTFDEKFIKFVWFWKQDIQQVVFEVCKMNESNTQFLWTLLIRESLHMNRKFWTDYAVLHPMTSIVHSLRLRDIFLLSRNLLPFAVKSSVDRCHKNKINWQLWLPVKLISRLLKNKQNILGLLLKSSKIC